MLLCGGDEVFSLVELQQPLVESRWWRRCLRPGTRTVCHRGLYDTLSPLVCLGSRNRVSVAQRGKNQGGEITLSRKYFPSWPSFVRDVMICAESTEPLASS